MATLRSPSSALLALSCLLPTFLTSTVALTDQEALAPFKNATVVGESGAALSANWTGNPCFQAWIGVSCDDSGHIIALNLPAMNLTGSIPSELENLSSLTVLNLSQNRLTGQLPPHLGNSSSLTLLNVSGNNLTGPIPPQLGNLLNLITLDLSQNALNGSIPVELTHLTNLTALSLYRNNLTGSLPPQLGTLLQLQTLHISHNNFTGPLPPELANLTSLQHLYANQNSFNGTIPPALANLSNLLDLNLHRNDLTGPIPETLGSFPELLKLSLFDNQLSGSIPSQLGNLKQLDLLALNQNNLTGIIPPQLGNLSNLTVLGLFQNSLSGPIPTELGNLQKVKYFGLFGNNLTGSIPPALATFPDIIGLSLSQNSLSGPIPVEFGNISETLTFLDLSQNFLNGTVPAGLNRSLNSTASPRVVNIYGVKIELASSSSSVALNCIGLSPGHYYEAEQRDSQACARIYPELTCDCLPRAVGINGSCYCVTPFQVQLLFTFEEDDSANNFTTSLSATLRQLAVVMSVEVPQLAPTGFSFPPHGVLFSYNVLPVDGTELSGVERVQIRQALQNQLPNVTVPYFKPGFFFVSAQEPDLSSASQSRATTAKSRNDARNAVLSTVGAAFVMILAMGSVAVLLLRNRQKRLQSPPRVVIPGTAMKSWGFEDLDAATNNFAEDRMLGRGGFGIVYRAKLDGLTVAIKRLELGNGAKQGHIEFIKELEVVGSLHHRNLVNLVGYCIEGPERLLVYEFMSSGSLNDWLFEHPRGYLSWAQSVRVLLGTASALSYLHHECKKKIIHRDIKPANVLLDSNLEPHLSDFGIARSAFVNDTHVTTKVMGTFGFMAPEYAQTGQLTEKSDVYSFGVMMLVTISDRAPFWVRGTGESGTSAPSTPRGQPVGLIESTFRAYREDRLLDLVAPHFKGTFDKEEARRILSIALLCTQGQWDLRPPMEQVVRMINGQQHVPFLPKLAREPTIPSSGSSYEWSAEFTFSQRDISFTESLSSMRDTSSLRDMRSG